jgi:putative ABC transport system substrate-binding protein
MKRRGFITLLGGAAASWPLAARAQQPARPAKIGVLYPGLASILPSRVTALRDGLQRLGYREPDNFELILRSADGDPTRIIPLAMELVERKVDVILAVSAPAVTAARSATTTTPIVAFDLESDPIGSGLINNFSRPGGQVTGIFFDFPEFSKKWLELLKEAMPQLSSVAVLWDPATGPMQRNGVEIAGKELNVKLEILEVSGLADLDDAILAASGKGVDAILMLSSPVFGTNPERVAGLTVGVRLPAVTLFPDFARAGGLMAYGVNPINIFRQGAPIVAKVLRGSKPVFHRGFLGCSIARVDKHSHAGGSGYQLAQELQPLCGQFGIEEIDPGQVSAGPSNAGDKTACDRVFSDGEDDRDCRGRRLRGQDRLDISACDDGHPSVYQIGRQLGQTIIPPFCPAIFDRHALAFDIAGFLQTLAKRAQSVRERIGRCRMEKPDHRHRRLLRARPERPRRHRAAEQSDELPPRHSITSSARASNVGGTSRPSALAALRLITNSYLTGAWTGSSLGFSPLRMRSM